MRETRLAFSLLLLALCSGIVVSLWAASPDSTSARENPILRDYFRRRYLNFVTPSFTNSRYALERDRRRHLNERFLEARVDQLIDHFLKEINEELEALKTEFTRVENTHSSFAASSPDSPETGNLRKQFKKSLETMSDHADDLRDRLAFVFSDLQHKEDLDLQTDAGKRDFGTELHFIQEQLKKAEQRINDYLFAPTHTISVNELKGENMLIHLYRVQKMCKALSDQL